MAHEEQFARPVFRGGRFDRGEGMPVEALPEVVAYAEIVTELAKSLFKQRNPGRQRVPRGFEDRLRLRLKVVEPGSQAPVLTRQVPDGRLAIPDEGDEAHDLLAEVVSAAAEGRQYPVEFPREMLPSFARLGQRLQPGEHIALRRRDGSEAVYDRDVRNRLIVSGGQSYLASGEFVGHVADLNSDRRRFDLRLPDGTVLSGEYGTAQWGALHAAQGSPPETGERVKVEAEAEFNVDGQPERLVVLRSVVVLDTWEWAHARLGEIAEIEAGWFDAGYGEPVAESVVESVREFLGGLEVGGVRPPNLFATPDGGVQAEWRSDARTVSVEFGADGTAALFAVDVATREDRWEEVDADGLGRAVAFAAGEVK